jgi:AAA domain
MDLSELITNASTPITDATGQHNLAQDVFAEILEWSTERPAWQRDALRRLFTSEKLSAESLGELVELCKTPHGLSNTLNPKPLKAEHLAVSNTQTLPVSLVSVTHRRGVNALASEQTVAFGPNLTVVYGPNAAGKSGYTRILKRACRSRGIEDILGNVLSGETPVKAQATIRYQEGTTEIPLDWGHDSALSGALASVSVFDSHCASVYLRDKTDVAFRPFGLDIFDKLSSVCAEVRERLEGELQKINKAIPSLPVLAEGTCAKRLVDNLTALTKVDDLRRLATLSSDEERRLKELQVQRRDFQSGDPKQRSRELRLKAERFNAVVRHVQALSEALGHANISKLRAAADGVHSAKQVLSVVREAATTSGLLPGTGGDAWKNMWQAVSKFSEQAYPGGEFPQLKVGALCPFCQQTINEEAATRLKHFAEYVTSKAQAALYSAERTLADALKASEVVVERSDITLSISELAADNGELAQRITDFLAEAARIQYTVKNAAGDPASLPVAGLGMKSVEGLGAAIKGLQDRSAQLDGQKASLDPKLETELRELEARMTLRDGLQGVLDEIERKKRIGAYKQCLDDTSTQPITRKSTELTTKLVTESLRNTFKAELRNLEFTHLAVEVQSAGGAKGTLFHRLAFTNAPGVAVSDVLSEGESRTLSLAAFLTELSTASSRSAIIFDDPVSSLDHIWRERIARRLVSEASKRQVIVFTHDLLFLRLLLDEAGRQGIDCQNQYVRRDGQAGICSPDLPWIAAPVKDRIGKLRVRWQVAEKLQRTSTSEAYESAAREMYGLLREAWEKAVSEVLLNDVVERYRPSIETQKLRHLHDITPGDTEIVEKAMTECSRWIRGHDHPAADGTPVPSPAELKQRIDELENWVKAVRQRRN